MLLKIIPILPNETYFNIIWTYSIYVPIIYL